MSDFFFDAISEFGHAVSDDREFADCVVDCVVWHGSGRSCFEPIQDWDEYGGNAGVIRLKDILWQARERFGKVSLVHVLIKSGMRGWLFKWESKGGWILDGITCGYSA